MRVFVRLLFLAPVVFILADCGGSSGDPPTKDSLLQGDYHYLSLRTTPLTMFVRSETGRCSANGAGRIVFEDAYEAEEGHVSGPFTPAPRTYVVNQERSLSLTDFVGSTFLGKVAEDGSLAQATARDEGDTPGLFVMVRRLEEPTASELGGSWHLLRWYRSPNPAWNGYGAVGKVTVGATGDVTFTSYTYNRDGDIDPLPSVFGSQVLVPAGDGGVEWRSGVTGDVWMRGALSEDGNLVLLGATQAWLGFAGFQILVREGQGMSASDAVGVFDSGGFVFAPNGVACNWGLWSFDTGGVGETVIGANTHTQMETPTAVPISAYTVAGDGQLDISQFWGASRGAADPSGRFLVVGGAVTGFYPWLVVAIR